MCKISSSQIAADGQAVGQALDQLSKVLAQTEPELTEKLETASKDLIEATANWKTGAATAELEDAEIAAILVLNAIPVTTPYASFVAIAFTALNLLLANSQTQATQTGNSIADVHTLLSHAKLLSQNSPWYNKAHIKHQWFHTPQQDFKAAWNHEVEIDTSLGMHAL